MRGRPAIAFAAAMAIALAAPAARAAVRADCPPATRENATRLRAEVDLLRDGGKLGRAIDRARCLVDVAATLFGPNHASTINVRHDLADLLRQAGRDAEAARLEPGEEEAGSSQAGAADPSALEQALVRAKSLLDRGDTEGAAKEALAAKRLAFEGGLENTLLYVAVLNEGGRVMERMGDTAMAVDLYQRSSELATSFGKGGRAARGVALNNLGLLYSRLGRTKDAIATLEQALKLDRKDSVESAPTKVNLARAYQAEGQHAKAKKILLAARDQVRRAYGDSHPFLRAIYVTLTSQSWSAGRLDEAAAWQRNVNETVEHNVREILQLGSERQKLAYMADSQDTVDASVDLCLDLPAQHVRAGRLALEAVLQRKGRVLAAYAASLERLRSRSSQVDATLWSEFVEYQRRRSEGKLGATPPDREVDEDGYRALLERVGSADRAAEDLIRSVTIEQVRAALPPRSVLLEFVAYRPQGPKRSRAVRYAVFALSPEQELAWAPLGEEAAIDTGVRDLRAALANPDSTTVESIAQDLFRLILGPIEPKLKNVDRIFVSPDGALTLLPMGALVGSDGRYLVDRFVIDYLTSGRSLVASERRAGQGGAPVIVADPAFGPCGQGPPPACEVARPSPAAKRAGLERLCGTRTEAAAISGFLPGATTLKDLEATETAVKQVRSPRVLHLATHGFFGLEIVSAIDACAGAPSSNVAVAAASTGAEDSLLHSGLILAGANQRRSGHDDGLLTAAEVSTMNLTGTELVVLSACQTGLGEMVQGEGLFGLRRAFELAGAASLVMSLWSVGDASTAGLMTTFYQSLFVDRGNAGGVADALTLAQRRMLHDDKGLYTHPYYWAPFIASGRWTPPALKAR